MTLREFVEFTRQFPTAEITRAVRAALAQGRPPRTKAEYLRFRVIVWLELQGRLRHSA